MYPNVNAWWRRTSVQVVAYQILRGWHRRTVLSMNLCHFGSYLIRKVIYKQCCVRKYPFFYLVRGKTEEIYSKDSEKAVRARPGKKVPCRGSGCKRMMTKNSRHYVVANQEQVGTEEQFYLWWVSHLIRKSYLHYDIVSSIRFKEFL